MQFRLPLFLAFLSSILLLILHLSALEHFLYWTIPWFDILLHLLGGFTIGLTLVAIIKNRDFPTLLTVSVVGAFIFAFAWELFEYFIGVTFVAQNVLMDSLGDVLFSLFGAMIAGSLVYYLKKYDRS